jgi:hypothetical protein
MASSFTGSAHFPFPGYDTPTIDKEIVMMDKTTVVVVLFDYICLITVIWTVLMIVEILALLPSMAGDILVIS